MQAAIRRVVTPRNVAQKLYLQAMQDFDITISIGPAGTGKTFLAVAAAAAALSEKAIKRIVLCRPAVEAGERLGFLPGDIAEKVNPYLRPLYDSLYDIIGLEKVDKLMERGVIEIAPLAFMRGRTLNDAFIILDEAQNTTPEQMKMFLTRLGFGSKAVVTGDVTQVDLPEGKKSGLREARQILNNVEGIKFFDFTRQGRGAPSAGAEDRRGLRRHREKTGEQQRGRAGGCGRGARALVTSVEVSGACRASVAATSSRSCARCFTRSRNRPH